MKNISSLPFLHIEYHRLEMIPHVFPFKCMFHFIDVLLCLFPSINLWLIKLKNYLDWSPTPVQIFPMKTLDSLIFVDLMFPCPNFQMYISNLKYSIQNIFYQTYSFRGAHISHIRYTKLSHDLLKYICQVI